MKSCANWRRPGWPANVLTSRSNPRRWCTRHGCGLAATPGPHGRTAGTISQRRPGILRVNDALAGLEALDPRKAELVKLRYFVGLSFAEAAAALGIAVATAKQWWAFSRAWLSVELAKD
jgi:ECF sigma factor